jgi:hypothetical protein
MKTLNITLAFLIVAGICASVNAGELTKSSQKEIKTAGLFQDDNFYRGGYGNSYQSRYRSNPYHTVGYRNSSYGRRIGYSNGNYRYGTSSCANGQCSTGRSCANGNCGHGNGSCANGQCGTSNYGPRRGYGSYRRGNGNLYNAGYNSRNRGSYQSPSFFGLRLQSPISYRSNRGYGGRY